MNIVETWSATEYVAHVRDTLRNHRLPLDPATGAQQSAAIAAFPWERHRWRPSPGQPGTLGNQWRYIQGMTSPETLSDDEFARLVETILERSRDFGLLVEVCLDAAKGDG